jgi:hypothetical protein
MYAGGKLRGRICARRETPETNANRGHQQAADEPEKRVIPTRRSRRLPELIRRRADGLFFLDRTAGPSRRRNRFRCRQCNRPSGGRRTVRNHWNIENKLHWVLDMTFREDESWGHQRRLAENLGWLRRLALTLLKQHSGKESIAMKHRLAGWSTDYLMQVPTGTTT